MKGVQITYGKAAVPVYRAYGTPLDGPRRRCPSRASPAARTRCLAVEVDVEVFGENFLPAYTEGDNSDVVATDTMKNFILRQGRSSYDGATLEGFLAQLGRGFLETYAEMEALRLSGARAALRPRRRACSTRRSHDDHGVARAATSRATATVGRCSATCAAGVSGSSCSRSRAARSPASCATSTRRCPSAATGRSSSTSTCTGATPTRPTRSRADPSRYVAAEQVRDVVAAVFHEFV